MKTYQAKHIIITFILSVCFLTGFSQNDFEGKLEMQANDGLSNTMIEWLIKDGKHLLQYDIKSEHYNASFSVLCQNGEVKIISNGAEMPIKPSQLASKHNLRNATIVKEEKNLKLNGFNCRRLSMEADHFKAELWLTEIPGFSVSDFPQFMQMNLPEIGTSVPVKWIIRDHNGNLLNSQTITAISAEAVSFPSFE